LSSEDEVQPERKVRVEREIRETETERRAKDLSFCNDGMLESPNGQAGE
jgi:hypothetical protein